MSLLNSSDDYFIWLFLRLLLKIKFIFNSIMIISGYISQSNIIVLCRIIWI
jgi:hypothetical protein